MYAAGARAILKIGLGGTTLTAGKKKSSSSASTC